MEVCREERHEDIESDFPEKWMARRLGGRPQLDSLNQDVIKFGQEQNILVVDVTPAIKEAAPNAEFLYFRHDMHLNALGNKIVADFLTEKLPEIIAQ